jgi:hypothetical protein
LTSVIGLTGELIALEGRISVFFIGATAIAAGDVDLGMPIWGEPFGLRPPDEQPATTATIPNAAKARRKPGLLRIPFMGGTSADSGVRNWVWTVSSRSPEYLDG